MVFTSTKEMPAYPHCHTVVARANNRDSLGGNVRTDGQTKFVFRCSEAAVLYAGTSDFTALNFVFPIFFLLRQHCV